MVAPPRRRAPQRYYMPYAMPGRTALGEPTEEAATAEAAADGLCRTSLLEQVDVGTSREYTLHPATAQFIATRFGDDAPLRGETHSRIGGYLEEHVNASRSIESGIEAGHHLFEAGKYDRASELLGSASQWLQERGHVREGLQLLERSLAQPIRQAMKVPVVGQLLGTI